MNSDNAKNEEAKPAVKRRPFTPPTIEHLGELVDLTRSGGGSTTDSLGVAGESGT